jgi:hypothetical protein
VLVVSLGAALAERSEPFTVVAGAPIALIFSRCTTLSTLEYP